MLISVVILSGDGRFHCCSVLPGVAIGGGSARRNGLWVLQLEFLRSNGDSDT